MTSQDYTQAYNHCRQVSRLALDAATAGLISQGEAETICKLLLLLTTALLNASMKEP